MRNAVQKWGNSLGLRIPSAIAQEMNIKRGTPVTLRLADGVLTIRVAMRIKRRKSKHSLKALIHRMSADNVQPTYDWGADVGEEIL